MSKSHVSRETSWLSTYSLVTVRRLLERYRISLNDETLVCALTVEKSFFHRLLSVPFQHILNGLLFQQIHDYQVYAQKLFLDYLLSGESDKTENAPGSETREALEIERNTLLAHNQKMETLLEARNKAIANSQKTLIGYSDQVRKVLKLFIEKTINKIPELTEENLMTFLLYLLANYSFPASFPEDEKIITDLKNKFSLPDALSINEVYLAITDPLTKTLMSVESDLNMHLANAKTMSKTLEVYRTELHDFILRVHELLMSLSDYKPNLLQVHENLQALQFNTDLSVSEEA